jgi:tetraacyldisaccharide 4'-kinase
MLAEAGVAAAATLSFPDHHPYAASDIDRLIERARQSDADGFATTEKDAVKLTPAMLGRLETLGPVLTARLEVELFEQSAVIEALVSRLAKRTA